jgi:hypothetical protein
VIIAAYAGCGKTFFAQISHSALDLHCMPYKYFPRENNERGESGKADPNNEMRPEWPYNYVAAIENAMKDYEYILIPSDFRVLALLKKKQICYTLIYPHKDAKEEYLKRYLSRGNTENFLSIFYEHWDWFIDNLEADNYGKKIVLQPYQFLSDVIIKETIERPAN